MEPHDLSLVVYYDGDCGLCRRVAALLDAQEQLVPITCLAAQQAAGGRLPDQPRGPARAGHGDRERRCDLPRHERVDRLLVGPARLPPVVAAHGDAALAAVGRTYVRWHRRSRFVDEAAASLVVACSGW